jgi:glycosyltransferase involved in cell wall biosynthesis
MTYNHVSFIEDALKGFVMQKTNFPFIAVIVDDASTDGTASIIKQYEETYPDIIKGVYLKENHHTLKKSKQVYLDPFDKQSKYIALCEGDDYWTDPLKLQKQVEFLDHNPDYLMCCTAFSQTENEDNEHKIDIIFDLNDITIDDILTGAWIGTLTTVFRSTAFLQYEAPLQNLPMGDLPLWCDFSLKGKIKYFNYITANYRRLDSSACHFTDEKRQTIFDLAELRVKEYYAKVIDKEYLIKIPFAKKAHYFLDRCFMNQWIDFPIDEVWHYIKQYDHPSGYDRLKYWGMKSRLNHFISDNVISLLKKIR